MLSPQALIKGLVQRALPSAPNSDSPNIDVALRLWNYGEQAIMPLIRKQHLLADEGSYYTCGNNQTAIAPTYGTSFSATAPFLVIQNQNTQGQRLYLDYAALTVGAAGTSTTGTQGQTALALIIDNTLRYSSGGSNLTANIVNTNMASPQNNNGAAVYAGAITATAANASRALSGERIIRPGVSQTVLNVVGDMNLLNFGGVEGAVGSITIANANIMPQALPPVVIAPGHSALVYIWYPGATSPTAATYIPEVGFWIR